MAVKTSKAEKKIKGLRGDSVVLMGKNTMMKRSIRIHSEKTGNKTFLNLIPLLVGNVGLIFTKGDLKEVSEEVAKYKVKIYDLLPNLCNLIFRIHFCADVVQTFLSVQVGAPARVGLVAPVDVVVPPGNTGLDPSQTSFFQVCSLNCCQLFSSVY
ncbi:hypothetical protein C3L33_02872, partial [Rhododendron williamsianum]